MQFRCKQLATFGMCLAAFVCGLLPNAVKQAAYAETAQTRVLASITCPSEDSLWKAVEKLASEMQSAQLVSSLRIVAEMKFDALKKLESSKSFGFVVATNETDVIPFAYIPVKSDEFGESDVNGIKDAVKSLNSPVDLEVFLDNSTVFFTLPQFKNLIPTNIDSLVKNDAKENESVLLSLDLKVSEIPQEFVEAGFASVRQKVAERAVETSETELENLNYLLKYYSAVIESLDELKISILVDQDDNLSFNCAVKAKSGSQLAKQFQKKQNVATRWNAIFDTNNTILASVDAGVQNEELKEYQARQFKDVACKNLLNQLDVLVDDPDDFEFAKQLVKIVEEEGLASLEKGVTDSGIAIGVDPDVIKFGVSVAKPEGLKKALQLVVDRLDKDVDKLEQYVALDAETLEGFSVSKINVPIYEIAPSTIDYLNGKSLVAWLGVDSQSVALVLGLDESDVQKEFTKLIVGAKETKPAPTRSFVDCKPAMVLLNTLLTENENITPEARATIAKLAESESLKVISECQITDDVLNAKLIVDHNVFKAAGEIVKLNIRGFAPVGEDNSEDLDDIFEEE